MRKSSQIHSRVWLICWANEGHKKVIWGSYDGHMRVMVYAHTYIYKYIYIYISICDMCVETTNWETTDVSNWETTDKETIGWIETPQLGKPEGGG